MPDLLRVLVNGKLVPDSDFRKFEVKSTTELPDVATVFVNDSGGSGDFRKYELGKILEVELRRHATIFKGAILSLVPTSSGAVIHCRGLVRRREVELPPNNASGHMINEAHMQRAAIRFDNRVDPGRPEQTYDSWTASVVMRPLHQWNSFYNPGAYSVGTNVRVKLLDKFRTGVISEFEVSIAPSSLTWTLQVRGRAWQD